MESLFPDAPLVYEISVCGKCRASLEWMPDRGEGMSPRAWCRGPEKHLVVVNSSRHGGSVENEPLRITVQEVVVA